MNADSVRKITQLHESRKPWTGRTGIFHCGHESTPELRRPHPCPYAYDIGSDASPRCTCCPGCTQQCAWDV